MAWKFGEGSVPKQVSPLLDTIPDDDRAEIERRLIAALFPYKLGILGPDSCCAPPFGWDEEDDDE